MIYFSLVQSWFRIYVGLVCGLFGLLRISLELVRVCLIGIL